MATVPRKVWRASPTTLALVGALVLIGLLAIPGLAVLVWQRQHTLTVPVILGVIGAAVAVYGWRFGLHPRIDADRRLVVVNPFRRAAFDWAELTVIRPGENGLVLATPGFGAEAWCVQKSTLAGRRGWLTRADRIAFALVELADRHAPAAIATPLSGPELERSAEDATGQSGKQPAVRATAEPQIDEPSIDEPPIDEPRRGSGAIRIRRARHDEVQRLARMEQAASEAELGHIFPPEDHGYPYAEIAHRWRALIRDPRVSVRILEDAGHAVGYLAFDTPRGTRDPSGDARIRHLGVLPEQMGRGLGGALLEFACAEVFQAGAERAVLWVLADNTRARDFYRHRGWSDTERVRGCEFPPYPDEVMMVRGNPASARRAR